MDRNTDGDIDWDMDRDMDRNISTWNSGILLVKYVRSK
jgi:hypothetical protein